MAWSYDPTNLTTDTASGRKFCGQCGLNLPLSSFHKNSSSKDGLRSNCKSCKNARDEKYRQDNKDRIKSSQTLYYSNNKELFFYHNAKRRARNREATPSWLSYEQKAHIKRTYKLSALMKEATGIDYHVDHIVPLNGKDICGLNVPWNLRVIQAKDNLSKSNKLEV